MSYEFGTKTDYEKGIFRTTWTWWPEDTLNALDLLLVYFGINDKLVRPQEVAVIRRDSNLQATLHRALHDKAIRSAVRLIAPGKKCAKYGRRAMCWYVRPTFDTKGRLAGAGLDINTLNIIDQRRWAFAWHQLSNGNTIYYSAPENDILNASAHETPPVEPVVKQVTTTFTPGQPAKVAHKFTKKNNFVWRDHKRIYDPRAAAELNDSIKRAEGPEL
jgi:hypothetical protein